jgi:ABC-type nickel/cobalt efflux system permease component RcnA
MQEPQFSVVHQLVGCKLLVSNALERRESVTVGREDEHMARVGCAPRCHRGCTRRGGADCDADPALGQVRRGLHVCPQTLCVYLFARSYNPQTLGLVTHLPLATLRTSLTTLRVEGLRVGHEVRSFKALLQILSLCATFCTMSPCVVLI